MFPAFTYDWSLSTISSCPTTSERVLGLYFSSQISFILAPTTALNPRAL
jgi:hypothetical protein